MPKSTHQRSQAGDQGLAQDACDPTARPFGPRFRRAKQFQAPSHRSFRPIVRINCRLDATWIASSTLSRTSNKLRAEVSSLAIPAILASYARQAIFRTRCERPQARRQLEQASRAGLGVNFAHKFDRRRPAAERGLANQQRRRGRLADRKANLVGPQCPVLRRQQSRIRHQPPSQALPECNVDGFVSFEFWRAGMPNATCRRLPIRRRVPCRTASRRPPVTRRRPIVRLPRRRPAAACWPTRCVWPGSACARTRHRRRLDRIQRRSLPTWVSRRRKRDSRRRCRGPAAACPAFDLLARSENRENKPANRRRVPASV